MALLINASIDLTKIIKSKIKTKDKNGNPFKNKQQYYEVTITINDSFDQFNNNVQITDAQTQEQRKAKEDRNFLGNGRVVWRNEPEAVKAEIIDNEQINNSPTDDLPF